MVFVDYFVEFIFCGGGGEVEFDEYDDGIGYVDKIENWEVLCCVDVKWEKCVKDVVDGGKIGGEGVDMCLCERGIWG